MKRWWLVIALLLSLGVNLGILAALLARRPPQPGPEDPPRTREEVPGQDIPVPDPEGPPPRVIRLADRLGLEGERRRRFIDLQAGFFADTVRLRARQVEAYRELRRELTARRPDQATIEALTQESARLHLALEQAMARNVIASREVLDPEQERLYLRIISRLRPPGARPGGLGQQEPPRRPRWRQGPRGRPRLGPEGEEPGLEEPGPPP